MKSKREYFAEEITVLAAGLGRSSLGNPATTIDIADYLNTFVSKIESTIREKGGCVTENRSGQVIAVWRKTMHPFLACEAAISIRDEVQKVIVERVNSPFPYDDLFIGLARGPAAIEMTENRCTEALGSVVNIAVRLQETARRLGVRVLMDKAVAETAESAPSGSLCAMRDIAVAPS